MKNEEICRLQYVSNAFLKRSFVIYVEYCSSLRSEKNIDNFTVIQETTDSEIFIIPQLHRLVLYML